MGLRLDWDGTCRCDGVQTGVRVSFERLRIVCVRTCIIMINDWNPGWTVCKRCLSKWSQVKSSEVK